MAKIKKDTNLRKAILQAAITGQLISNVDGATETGKQLLDRIIEKRNKKLLADWEEAKKKNQKAKKPAPIVASEIAEDEIPFEIPESWCWCRLGDVGNWKAGSTPSRSNPEFYNGNIPWLKTGDLTDDFVDVIPECISEIALKSCSMRLNPVGSVLIAMYGATIGKLGILNIEATTNQACCACITHKPISNKYLFYYLMSQKKALTEKAEGGAQPNISREKLVIYPFPLPPLAVQNAIVAKLEEVLPLVDAYENAVLQKEELKTALPDKVKKAILQEAIQGKLTEDWRKTATIEETGKQLLERIIEERKKMSHGLDFANAKSGKRKSKKETALAGSNPCDIPEDQIPFEIPESWCWCRLGDVGDFLRGSGIKREETRLEGYPCIRYGEMYTKYKTVINETVSFVEKEIFDKCQKIKTNDIVMSLTGENEYDIALAAVYLGEKVVAMGGDMTRFRPCLINSLFYVYAINSPYGIECKSQLATGNIIVHISNDKLSSILFPLPPLAEQKKIVEIIEQMLPLCEKLGG